MPDRLRKALPDKVLSFIYNMWDAVPQINVESLL